MQVREIEVSRLRPWEGNPRLNDDAVDAVVRSIKAFGFNVPILCDRDLNIIAGHTRWKAAQRLGLGRVPVIVIDMTSEQRRAFSVADNKTAEIAEWNFPRLQEVLEELQSEGIDLTSLGYSEAELRALLEPEADFDWDAFDLQLASAHPQAFVLLPVKVRREMRDALMHAINQYARDHGIKDDDPAIAAGWVVRHLLGLMQCENH